MTKFYKIYEILDNIEEELECYPKYFFVAYLNKKSAEDACKNIETADCNSTKIEFAEINENDIQDIDEFGLQVFDEEVLKEIARLKKEYKNNRVEELVK